MKFNIDDLKKKIIYRSNYRGTKEMDMLLGSFTKKYINELDESDLFDLSDLLNQEDEILYKYKNDEDTTNKIKETKISKLFKIFNYKLK